MYEQYSMAGSAPIQTVWNPSSPPPPPLSQSPSSSPSSHDGAGSLAGLKRPSSLAIWPCRQTVPSEQIPFLIYALSSMLHLPFSVKLHISIGVSQQTREKWRALDVLFIILCSGGLFLPFLSVCRCSPPQLMPYCHTGCLGLAAHPFLGRNGLWWLLCSRAFSNPSCAMDLLFCRVGQYLATGSACRKKHIIPRNLKYSGDSFHGSFLPTREHLSKHWLPFLPQNSSMQITVCSCTVGMQGEFLVHRSPAWLSQPYAITCQSVCRCLYDNVWYGLIMLSTADVVGGGGGGGCHCVHQKPTA